MMGAVYGHSVVRSFFHAVMLAFHLWSTAGSIDFEIKLKELTCTLTSSMATM